MVGIEERVLATLQQRAATVDSVSRATRIADLGLDSLEVIERIFALEDDLGIRIALNADGAYGGFETVDDIIRTVEVEVAKQA